VSQTIRGGGRDAPIHQLLANADVPPVDRHIARLAGELLGKTGGSDVADAQLAAEAISGAEAAVVLTGDMGDLGPLVAGHGHVRLQAI
jgi:hypothetical protein